MACRRNSRLRADKLAALILVVMGTGTERPPVHHAGARRGRSGSPLQSLTVEYSTEEHYTAEPALNTVGADQMAAPVVSPAAHARGFLTRAGRVGLSMFSLGAELLLAFWTAS